MIKQTVGDFVAVYNQLKNSLSSASSMSGSTTGLRELERSLSALVGQVLTSDPNINKLADIGISTTRDGLLSLDSAKLDTALATNAGAVEALFNPRRDATHTEATDPGIAFTLDAIRDKAVGTDGVIDRVSKSLEVKQDTLTGSSKRSRNARTPIRRGWKSSSAASMPNSRRSRRRNPISNSRSRCGITRIIEGLCRDR